MAIRGEICFLLCLSLLGITVESQPLDITFDSLMNRTDETFQAIYDPMVNYTKPFVHNISNSIENVLDPLIGNRSTENKTIFYDYIKFHMDIDKMKNCSIVVGIAAGGAVVGTLAIFCGVPLMLCLLGFTCWGIAAGSAAACCQSGIGDVPAGSPFSCAQSLGAGGGGWTYLVVACIIGIPLGLYVGGYYGNIYFHCFF